MFSDNRAEAKRRAAVESMLSLARDEYRASPAAAAQRESVLAAQEDGSRAVASLREKVDSIAKLRAGGCANPNCKQGWMMPWRTKKRPFFEGRSACKGDCMTLLVRAAVLREGGERRSHAVTAPHRHRVPLGLVMLAQGWITNPQLQRALASQRESGRGRIGEWLIAEGGLDAESVTRGLGVQWNCPVLSGDGFRPESMAMILPRCFVEKYGLLPLRIAGSQLLYLGFQNHLDVSAAYAIERMTELQIERGVVEQREFEREKARLLASLFPEVESEVVLTTEELIARITKVVEDAMAPRAKLVRLHQHFWLRVWKQTGAKLEAGTVPSRFEDVHDYLFTVGAEH